MLRLNEKLIQKISRKLTKILRHNPDPLTMDSAGWVKVNDILLHFNLSMDELNEIVLSNDKNRFMFNKDQSLICATQGHSIGIASDKEYVQITASQGKITLYYGTDDVTASLIKNDKILPGKRQYVHWSADIEVATKRAKQISYYNKTKPVLIVLEGRNYLHSGGKLLLAENNVYLTPEIKGEILKTIFI